ncbi:MAG: single-stranded DNA-binding protein [Microthrixaceae bacterium]|nr:single-stranded DNA-binding protein [Microthrixaceae bacterium]
MADNEITITGNLVREPELRFTAGGTATCGFGVAVNRRYQQNGEWVDAPTNFFNVTVWGQYGENVAASLSKGDRVLVKGRLDFRKYQNKDGVEVTTHDIIADEVAPSLKYATAQISRIERESTGSGARRGNGGGRRQQADPVYGDTEPFADLGAHRFGFRNMAGDL